MVLEYMRIGALVIVSTSFLAWSGVVPSGETLRRSPE
jgi:hypothetical protein